MGRNSKKKHPGLKIILIFIFMIDWRLTPTHQGGRTRSQIMPEKTMYVRAAESWYARPRPDSLVKSKAFWGYKCYRRKIIKKTELIHTVKSWLVLKIFRNYYKKVLEA